MIGREVAAHWLLPRPVRCQGQERCVPSGGEKTQKDPARTRERAISGGGETRTRDSTPDNALRFDLPLSLSFLCASIDRHTVVIPGPPSLPAESCTSTREAGHSIPARYPWFIYSDYGIKHDARLPALREEASRALPSTHMPTRHRVILTPPFLLVGPTNGRLTTPALPSSTIFRTTSTSLSVRHRSRAIAEARRVKERGKKFAARPA